MKKILIVLLVFLLMFNVVGCSEKNNDIQESKEMINTQTNDINDNPETTPVESESEVNNQTQPIETEGQELLDLTGLWVQQDANSESYMVATIKDNGTIGVFFIIEGEESTWTYWVGSYEAPETTNDQYRWTSENTYSGNGLLASNAKTKDFSYSNGVLSFDITIEGETGTVNLIRGDWDISQIPENTFAAVKTSQSDFQKPIIEDSGWILSNNKYLYYYIDLYNPNEDIAIEFPTVRVTARDSNNTLIDTEDQTLSIIYPQQHFVYAGLGFSVAEIPTTVDFEVLDPKDYELHKVNETNQFTPFEVVNTTMRSDKVVGEIVNPNNSDFDMVVVAVLLKNADGEIIAVDSTFVDNVKAGTNTPFSISVYGVEDVASVECYANQW